VARQDYLFTSESVSEGHPDKVCDRISDEIVDLVYREAKKTGMNAWDVRVACETLATTNRVVIAGEVRVPDTLLKKGKDGQVVKDAGGHSVVNPAKFKSVARKAIRAIGYEQSGFHWKTAKIEVLLHAQSADIAQGVDSASDRQGEEGAGDQGIMFGYACRETPDLMPAPIYYSHKILELLAAGRHAGEGDVGRLGPDAKSQVTVRYVGGKAAEATQIVLSTQHLDDSWDSKKVRKVVEPFIREALGDLKIADDCNWYINPTGKFVIGGPDGDAGLTGRKIIVDTYGGMGRHGGGAFSGKDPSKVDRSACYYARFVAKNVVAAGLAKRCEVQVAYAIGVAKPMGVYVHTFGTGKLDDEKLAKYVAEKFDFRPRALIEELDLLRPIYRPTAAYGHFGRAEFSWEKTSRAKELAADLGGSLLKGHGIANTSSNGNGKAEKAPAKKDKKPAAKGKGKGASASA
jgi:S-adenosylmethionine synthetase